jgi:hypothetical protein
MAVDGGGSGLLLRLVRLRASGARTKQPFATECDVSG